MILQALTRHYEDLLALGRIPRPGWTTPPKCPTRWRWTAMAG